MSRRTQRNPIAELRKPWRVEPGEERTHEVPNWREAYGGRRGDWSAIEVLTSGEDADVTVYLVETSRFAYKHPGLKPDTDFENLRERFDWTKEHATTVVRGEVGAHEVFCTNHRPSLVDRDNDACTVDCDKTDEMHTGWRGLLYSFLNQHAYFDRIDWKSPVVIDHAEPVILNYASLCTEALRAAYEAIANDARWVREYNEENEDSVSDIVGGADPRDLVAALFGERTVYGNSQSAFTRWSDEGRTYQVFNTGPNMSPAVEKWIDIIWILDHLDDHLDGEALDPDDAKRIRDDFRKHLAYEMNHCRIWTHEQWIEQATHPLVQKAREEGKEVSDGWKFLEGLEHSERELKFLTYSKDRQEDELRDDTRELLPTHEGVIWGESIALVEMFSNDLAAALSRIDVDWSGEDPYNITVELNAFWVFSVDVVDLEEWLNETIAPYRPVEDDDG